MSILKERGKKEDLTVISRKMEVVIEVSKGGFVKKNLAGRIDYISPLPCPYNYGSVRAYVSQDGDFLDALVLGPRLAAGAKVTVVPRGAVRFVDDGIVDDKLVCSRTPLTTRDRMGVLAFFYVYAQWKKLLNTVRGRRGKTACRGWIPVATAIADARPTMPGST